MFVLIKDLLITKIHVAGWNICVFAPFLELSLEVLEFSILLYRFTWLFIYLQYSLIAYIWFRTYYKRILLLNIRLFFKVIKISFLFDEPINLFKSNRLLKLRNIYILYYILVITHIPWFREMRYMYVSLYNFISFYLSWILLIHLLPLFWCCLPLFGISQW